MSALGEKIRKARRRADLTQAELANRIGRVQKTVSDYERGKSLPNTEMLAVIAEALDRAPDRFLQEGENLSTETKENGEEVTTLHADEASPVTTRSEEGDTAVDPGYVSARAIRVCAGDGIVPDEQGRVIVTADQYRRHHNTDPPADGRGSKWYAQVVGDSMAPELFDGQWVPVQLTDCPLDEVQASALYVVHYMGMIQLRRIQGLAEGKYEITCTNPTYANEVVDVDSDTDLWVCARVKMDARDQLIGSIMRKVVE